jgi:hypothetical protein
VASRGLAGPLRKPDSVRKRPLRKQVRSLGRSAIQRGGVLGIRMVIHRRLRGLAVVVVVVAVDWKCPATTTTSWALLVGSQPLSGCHAVKKELAELTLCLPSTIRRKKGA